MISRFADRWLPKIWTRLLVSVLLIAVMVWLVLTVAIYFFNASRSDFDNLAQNHIPRLALASELVAESADLSRLATVIISQQDDTSNTIRQELTDRFSAISRLIESPGLVPASSVANSQRLKNKVSSLFEQAIILSEDRDLTAS